MIARRRDGRSIPLEIKANRIEIRSILSSQKSIFSILVVGLEFEVREELLQSNL